MALQRIGESEVDKVAAKTEEMICELMTMPASRFNVNELFWIYQLYTNQRWQTTLEWEVGLQQQVRQLLGRVKGEV